MNVKYFYLKLMVLFMKWMTRYFGFIARPIVRLYASREIIACGLRSKNGDVNIIYSPQDNNIRYTIMKKNGKNWETEQTISNKKYSYPTVHQVKIPKAKINEVYRISATNKRNLHSPNITIKQNSIDISNIIKVDLLEKDKLKISWKDGDSYDPMIYFLIVENDKRNTISAIYTRDNYWIYPLVKEASLSLLNNPPNLDNSKDYHIMLLLVDFDGWVMGMGGKVFNQTNTNFKK